MDFDLQFTNYESKLQATFSEIMVIRNIFIFN